MAIYAEKKAGRVTGRFVVEVQRNNRRLREFTFDHAEAKLLERQMKAGMTSVEVTNEVTPALTFGQLVREHGRRIWRGSWNITSEARALKIAAILGDTNIARLKPLDIERVKEGLADRELAPSTINAYLSCLHKALDYAKRNELVDRVPEFDWLKKPAGRIRWLSAEEEEQLVAALKARGADDVASFVLVALDTGARRGELLNESSELDGDWFRFWDTKTNKPRSVPATDRAKEHWPLFRGLTAPRLRYFFNLAKEDIGLKDDNQFVVHTLRHTCASRLVQRGVSLAVVQKWMGHSNIQTTLRYAHLADADLVTAMEVLGS